NRLRFLGRKPLVVTEVTKNLPRLFRLDVKAIEPDHALDSLLPHFGRRADVGEPAHHAVGIALMTAAAFVDGQLMIYRDARNGILSLKAVRGHENQQRSKSRRDWNTYRHFSSSKD